MKIHTFTFNEFEENTYVLYDDSGACAIIDPGCNTISEQSELEHFINHNQLTPTLLLNTHCHIDHVFGNRFVAEKYNLPLTANEKEVAVLQSAVSVALLYQMYYDPSPEIEAYLYHGDMVHFGNTTLKVLFTPGHSPGSISFYHEASGVLISGDVLFLNSIGRTDLPGGDYDILIHSIRSQLFTLPNDTKVYPGHGDPTTIDFEKRSNPFLN
ncbi:MAG: MBL fold metallo-hydrolase [Chitinophagales bacterium]|nr:MBL fold metallo-hydrolase [Chitinophagales bacterium]